MTLSTDANRSSGRESSTNGTVVDLGCSRGGALAPFVATFGDQASYVGPEVSPPMLDACRTRFAREIATGSVSLLDLDLRAGYPNVEATLTLSVVTLRLYYGLKRANDYGDAEIERQRLSLEGVLVPVAAAWNEDLLVRGGFEEVECFWRCLNFAAWIGIKSPAS